jgi:hypothetical protein
LIMGRREISDPSDTSTVGGRSVARQSSAGSVPLLIGRLSSYPIERERRVERPDAGLVPLASALLQCRLKLDRAIGRDLSIDSVWSILLFVYVRQADSSGVDVASLSNLPTIAPGTVLLRWTMTLVSDGILELAEDSVRDAGPVVRLSSDALHNMDDWLRAAKAELARLV